jgi:hypothetical protein
MGIILLVIVVLVALVLTVGAWRRYEAELRRTPGVTSGGDGTDPLLFEPFEDSARHGIASHPGSSHHGDFGCGDSHRGACDVGGHGGFNGGHGGFDVGGHH